MRVGYLDRGRPWNIYPVLSLEDSSKRGSRFGDGLNGKRKSGLGHVLSNSSRKCLGLPFPAKTERVVFGVIPGLSPRVKSCLRYIVDEITDDMEKALSKLQAKQEKQQILDTAAEDATPS